MQIDRARVDGGEPGAELRQRRRHEAELHLDEMGALEVERSIELDAEVSTARPEVVLEDRHEVLAQRLDVLKRERIDDGQSLGERAVADLERGPPREIVAVRGRERSVAEDVAEGVEEDRVARRLLQAVHQLALVERVHVERLSQLDAAHEEERARGATHGRAVGPLSTESCQASATASRRSTTCISRTSRTR